MGPVVYQIILMSMGFVAMYLGEPWEAFIAASLVCGAIGVKK